jgi:nucleotide-binding universal stress UspA family protein
MKMILVPVDFSRTTACVVAHATQLARASGASVVLLNVTRVATLLDDHKKLEELAELTFALSGPEGGSEPRAIIGNALEFVGDPVPIILDQADRLQVEHIVMGARRPMSSMKRVLGATARGVLRGAACPVIVVPAPKPMRRDRERTGRRRRIAHE